MVLNFIFAVKSLWIHHAYCIHHPKTIFTHLHLDWTALVYVLQSLNMINFNMHSLLVTMVPWRTFDTHKTFPFHKSLFGLEPRPIYRFANFIGRYEPVADISVSANMPLIFFFIEHIDLFLSKRWAPPLRRWNASKWCNYLVCPADICDE